MKRLRLYPLSSLAKVFPDEICGEPFSGGSLLANETFSFQLAYVLDTVPRAKLDCKLSIESPLRSCISVWRVECVPSEFPAYPNSDGNYLRKTPGLYPDLLTPLTEDEVEAVPGSCRSLWFSVCPEGKIPAGEYPIRIQLSNQENGISEEICLTLRILAEHLPEQELKFTQWFHTDCIAAYYQLPIFSEEHWAWIEKFMRIAAEHGVNLLLTPLFTPPLDTKFGGERPTVQLVRVNVSEAGYSFDFSLLDRWITTAERAGIREFELSHLFTQWGAAHAPKIVAFRGNKAGPERVFGWDTDAGGPEYQSFLRCFLPELTRFLRERGIADRCWFHVSDEPGEAALEDYRRASSLLAEYLEGFPVIDALSDYAFYEQGLVRIPVAATNAIEPFLEHGVSPLWAYYCCSQGDQVGNRFFAMPSARNRILGLQLYRYNIAGFLHWGYNFYFSQYSKALIDPFRTTDAEAAFPSGDAFSVYPGRTEALPSLRLKVFAEALQDLRALRLLESKLGREAVLELVESEGRVTFAHYPQSEQALLRIRERVNQKLAENPGLS